ncbi:MAG: YetF domain-containing protein [Ignavibacteria bacterium]
MAELSVADLVLIVIIGESIGAIIPEEIKFSGTIVYILTLVSANFLLDKISFKSKKFKKFMEGTPVIVIRNGKVIQSNLKKEKISMDNLEEALRSKGLTKAEEVELGILETDGAISIIPLKKGEEIVMTSPKKHN